MPQNEVKVSIFETFVIFAFMETKGQVIKRLRKRNGLSQMEVGIFCSMNKSQISKLENDKVSNPEIYEKVLNALGYKSESKLTKISFPYTTQTILSMLEQFKKNNKDKYGIDELALYGSCARQEQTADSDIDIAVKLKSPNLLKLINIEDELQSIFEVKTDVISLSSKFLPGFIEQISKDLIYV